MEQDGTEVAAACGAMVSAIAYQELRRLTSQSGQDPQSSKYEIKRTNNVLPHGAAPSTGRGESRRDDLPPPAGNGNNMEGRPSSAQECGEEGFRPGAGQGGSHVSGMAGVPQLQGKTSVDVILNQILIDAQAREPHYNTQLSFVCSRVVRYDDRYTRICGVQQILTPKNNQDVP